MSPPNYGRGWRESMEKWLDAFRGYALPLAITGHAVTSVSPETAATLAATLMGLAVVVMHYLREARPPTSIADRVTKLEERADAADEDRESMKRRGTWEP